MTTKKRISRVLNPRENVLRVQPVANEPTSVLITGLDAGTSRITLIDEDNGQETVEVIVQFDVEYLRTLLARAVPTACILPIPGANNTIILTGTVAHAEDVDIVIRAAGSIVGGPERIINALRVGGVQQVQVDVVVVRVLRSELRRMSFDFLEVGQHHILASTVGGALTIPSTGIAGTLPGAPVITNTIGTPNGVPANLFLGVFNPEQAFFGLLQALKDESVLKVKAEPRLVSLSGRPSSFLDGGEQAVPVPAGLGQVGIQFEEFGTRLNCLPIVLGNGRIHLEVEPEVSDLNPAFGTTINGTTVPGRSTQRVHTTVELEDGQTYVIGGLIQHEVTGLTSKVPIVGEIPYLGAAFSRKSFNEVEFELIILVTPHLVDAMACNQVPKVLPGQETRSPDDFELFLEGILEAPHGSRDVWPNGRYEPAFKHDPTSEVFPCGSNGNSCGRTGCGGTCDKPGCGADQHAGPTPPAPATSSLGILYKQTDAGAAGTPTKPATLPQAGKTEGEQ
jgi:pilus assembly protein CpaC